MTGKSDATPGWRADPHDPERQRWWDGLEWAEYSRRAPIVVDGDPTLRRALTPEPRTAHVEPGTRWVALIGWSPVWAGTLALLWGLLGGPSVAILALALGATIWFAALDGRELRSRGALRVPNPLWALLGPLGYLVVRRRTVGSDDRGALIVTIASGVVIAVMAAINWAIMSGLAALGELMAETQP